METSDASLTGLAQQVFDALRRHGKRLVLAESCTGGLVASTLTTIPGISEVFCGSAVTYRNETKAEWLSVSREKLDDPGIGAVSEIVAAQMCTGVLAGTPEADIAASITGHLGPDAPPHLDGVVFIGITKKGGATPSILFRQLSSQLPAEGSLRAARRKEAARILLEGVLEELLQVQ